MTVVRPRQLVALALAGLLPSCAGAPPPRPAPRPPPPPAPVADPGSARAEELVAQARALRAAGDLAGARSCLEAALALAPADVPARAELADLLLADGIEADRVEALLAGVPEGHPRRDLLLGRLAELRGDLAGAVEAYGRALPAGDDPELRLRRALLLERLGRQDEAVSELERVRAADPGNAVARGRLAERYEAAGRLTEAEEELRALAEASPSRPEGWRRLAAFCKRHGQDDKARAAEARARDAEKKPRRDLRPLRPTAH
jgi:tetratricopeptide (TPR) repeat protein